MKSDQDFAVGEADEESTFDPIRDDFMTLQEPRMQNISNDLNLGTENSDDAGIDKKVAPGSEAEALNKMDDARVMKQQIRKRMSKRLQDFAGSAADQ